MIQSVLDSGHEIVGDWIAIVISSTTIDQPVLPFCGSTPRTSYLQGANDYPRGCYGPIVFSSQGFTVTDGDTIRMADGTPVRLVGFNTPEKFEPMCAREAELGNRASARRREIVSSGTSTVTKVACACAPGTQGTKKCNYGRSCGILRVDGKDVGETLIAEGLAVSFQCGRTKCPKMPRPGVVDRDGSTNISTRVLL